VGFRQNNKSKKPWDEWVQRNQDALNRTGIASIHYGTQDDWWQFLQDGFLWDWEVQSLGVEQLHALQNLLNRELSEEERVSARDVFQEIEGELARREAQSDAE